MVKTSLPAIVAALVALSLLRPAVGQSTETLLYDFWMPTCGPCRTMEPTVGRLISAGFPVQKVNIDGSPTERAIAARFHVQRVPCFVMVTGGQEVDRVVGSTSYSRLEQMVRRATHRSTDPSLPIARAQSPDTPLADSPWERHAPEARQGPARSVTWPPSGQPTAAPSAPDAQRSATSPSTSSSVYGNLGHKTTPATARFDSADRELTEVSVRLRVGDATGHSWGTGTIVDARSGEALVVTCGHLFRDMQDDPTRQWSIVAELFEWTPDGPRVVDRAAGEVISYDLDRDIGLVSIRPSRQVSVAKVAGPNAEFQPKLPVRSVGCDHGADPTVISTHVTAINRYLGAPNIEAAGAPVIGRSGGGLFTAQGELIGVCNAAEHEGNEGLYAAIESIHHALDQIGLSEIYLHNEPPSIASASGPAGQLAANELRDSSVVRGQEPNHADSEKDPFASSAPSNAADEIVPTAANQSSGLNSVEQAAWDEIMDRAAEAEIVCIIRPKQPEAQSEVITLNQVSAEFVRHLRRAQSSGSTITAPNLDRRSQDLRTANGASAPSSPWGAAR